MKESESVEANHSCLLLQIVAERRMWYEALPSLLLTGVFVCLPYAIVPVVHKLLNNGNAFSRLQHSTHQRFLYRRDGRLSGDPYVLKGLESIPD